MPKRSTTSPRSSEDRPTLFVDATNSTPLLKKILEAAGWTVELHQDHFKDRPDIPDHEWVEIIAPKNWAIISCDKSMRSWRTEKGKVRPVIERCKAKIFFLSGGGRPTDEYAHAIGLARRDICRIFKQNAASHSFSTIYTRGARTGKVLEMDRDPNESSFERTKRKMGDGSDAA